MTRAEFDQLTSDFVNAHDASSAFMRRFVRTTPAMTEPMTSSDLAAAMSLLEKEHKLERRWLEVARGQLHLDD